MKRKPTPDNGSAMTEEDYRRLKAYNAAGADWQAAQVLGLKVETFYSWRRKLGLPPKGRRGRKQIQTSYN